MTDTYEDSRGVQRTFYTAREVERVADNVDTAFELVRQAQPRCESEARGAARVIEDTYNLMLLNSLYTLDQPFGNIPEEFLGGAWVPVAQSRSFEAASAVFFELDETDCFGLAPMPDFDEEEPLVFPGLGVVMRAYPIAGTAKDEEDDVEPASFGIQDTVRPSGGSQGLVIASVALTAAVGIGWLLLRKS